MTVCEVIRLTSYERCYFNQDFVTIRLFYYLVEIVFFFFEMYITCKMIRLSQVRLGYFIIIFVGSVYLFKNENIEQITLTWMIRKVIIL